jgi:RNA-directed DNA polymerase
MNEFDQFVKHKLKAKYYIRYADDFVFLSDSRGELENLIPKIAEFLNHILKLTLHSDKVFIKTLASGVDFLGWVHFPYHRVLRYVTMRSLFKGIYKSPKNESLQYYLGFISHGDSYGLKQRVLNWYGLMEQRDS